MCSAGGIGVLGDIRHDACWVGSSIRNWPSKLRAVVHNDLFASEKLSRIDWDALRCSSQPMRSKRRQGHVRLLFPLCMYVLKGAAQCRLSVPSDIVLPDKDHSVSALS
jgi:hypothetical protein